MLCSISGAVPDITIPIPTIAHRLSLAKVSSDSDGSSSDGDGDDDGVGEGIPRLPGERSPALAVMRVDGGALRLYYESATDSYVARAYCDVHGPSCSKQRTLEASKRGRRAQGRPMGLLVSWLKAGMRPLVENEEDHKKARIRRRERVASRLEVEAYPDARPFLDKERDPWSDESDGEPKGQP